MQHVFRDTTIGLRQLRQKPGFTTIAIVTIALGIAANTAIFSVIYATFLEPLPYRDADRLVMVWLKQDDHKDLVSPREFAEWKRQAGAFEDLNAWSWKTASVSFSGHADQMQIAPATPGFLPMLGYGHPLALGRDFLDDEGTPGRNRVVILTHRVWRERLGSDPEIIGKPVRIDRKPHTVVGVLGAGPPDENQSQLWVPLELTANQANRDVPHLLVMGRLKPGVTMTQASAKLDAISQNIVRTERSSQRVGRPSVEPFRNNFLGDDTKRGLWLLLGAVVFVLLIACANVANLMLARGTTRQRELAVRTSLGASRARIVHQLLIESIVLAMLGGALGIALAAGLLKVVIALMPPFMLPTEAHVRLNIPVLLVTVAASALAGILFGAAPAWHASRSNVNELLKDAGPGLAPAGNRLRHALVVVEFALALMLLAAGGFALHALFTLANRDLGFRTDRLLTFALPIPQDRFKSAEPVALFYRQLTEKVQALPAAVSVSVSVGMPVRGPAGALWFQVAGTPADTNRAEKPLAGITIASPAYFETFRIPIMRGRVFREEDRPGAERVTIVNEAFVTRYLPDRDPLSVRLVIPQVIAGASSPGPPVEWRIVGVHADVADSPGNDRAPQIVLPFWQSPWPYASIAVRTAIEPTSVRQSIAAIIQSMDPDLPMADVKTMEQIVSESFVRDRFNTVLFGSFACVGLLLAALGVYGVMSFVVAQRTHEIGLRLALGANRWHIVRRVVGEGMLTAVAGTAVGSLGVLYVARTMRGVVSGLGDIDAVAIAAVTAILLGTAFVSCLAPAVRAASLDPMVALRKE